MLGDGRLIECDFVVVGIGVRPRTELASAPGLAIEDGICVDERLETSVPGVFAAGDAASVKHPFYGRRLRVEHWANALHQPAVAARGDAGQAGAVGAAALLLQRPVRARNGVHRARRRNRAGRDARRSSGPRVHRLLARRRRTGCWPA